MASSAEAKKEEVKENLDVEEGRAHRQVTEGHRPQDDLKDLN